MRSPQVSLVAVGPDTFLATAQRRGPVRVFVLTAGAGSFGAPRVISRRGDGDVVLAAAGNRVVAAYQVGDRVRLSVVR